MKDREKIAEIIKKNGTYNGRSLSFDYYVVKPDDLADALIAANVGDVTEWKEKVECAKRILQIPTLPNGTTDLSYFEYKGERIQDIARQRDEHKHRAEVAERALLTACVNLIKDEEASVDMELLAHVVYTKFLRKAEKELAEERKDV